MMETVLYRMGLLIRIIRPEQWYKNFVVFIGIFFSENLFSLNLIAISFTAFVVLSVFSGVMYILNDIIDRDRDKHHPDKRNRPIASGELSITSAAFFGIILFSLGSILAFSLGIQTFAVAYIFLLIGFLYSLKLKNIFIIDMLAISTTLVLRSIVGIVAISVPFSLWIVVCIFLLSIILVLGKRKGEIRTLGKHAQNHRKVLYSYSKPLVDSLMTMTVTGLFIAYLIYSVFSKSGFMVITMPVVTFLLFRYMYLFFSDKKVISKPEQLLKDKQMFIGILSWIVITGLVLYIL